MDERVKILEIEISYLKREIDRLSLFILNKKGDFNYINYNFGNAADAMDIEFPYGFNLN